MAPKRSSDTIARRKMRRNALGASGEPEMLAVRVRREPDKAKANRLAIALRCASDYAAAETKLPTYLEKAALRFDAQLQRAGEIALVLRLVDEAGAAGYPRRRNRDAESAFDKTADRIGLSSETVEKLYYANRGRDLEQFPAVGKTRKKSR
jgi:hypothetical protein